MPDALTHRGQRAATDSQRAGLWSRVSMSLAVLPSAFLPGTAYTPLVKAFTLHGVHARLTDPTLGRGEAAETLVERWVETTQDVDVLLAHSNAGLLAPRVRDRGRPGQRVVFMDAALLPDAGSTALAPPALHAGEPRRR